LRTKALPLAAGLWATAVLPSAADAAAMLYEAGFHLDGTTWDTGFSPPDALTDVPGLDASAFDEITGLGTLVWTIATAGSHTLAAYFDHGIDVTDNGFSNENGSVSGAPATGQSWEMDDPWIGDIFPNFDAGSLDDSNAVDTTSWPIGTDASMATGFDFLLSADQIATITIDIAESLTTSAFKLIQTDFVTGNTVEMAASLSIKDQGAAPAPATLALLAVGLLGLRRATTRR